MKLHKCFIRYWYGRNKFGRKICIYSKWHSWLRIRVDRENITWSIAEVNEDGLEEGFITENGKNAPIGLLKKLSGATDGVYPNRVAEVIKDLVLNQ